MLDHPRLGRVPVETSRMRFSRTPATTVCRALKSASTTTTFCVSCSG
jgi:hypothetical protein